MEPQLTTGEGANDMQYFLHQSYICKPREYGTPLYQEVLFISFPSDPENVAIEVRRNPRRNQDGNAFIPINAAHIRLTNRYCYHPDAIGGFCKFLADNSYQFVALKRIDICMDFNRFDNGELPGEFLKAFIAGKYAKINLANIALHGVDGWDGRQFNSIKWGSNSSNITTKLYNKSLEMKQCRPKTYIQDKWKEAGLNTNQDIWRVEFSIKAGTKGFKHIKTQEFHKMQLEQFRTRDRCLFIFHMLAAHYFHFKYNEFVDGKRKRKDRCRDKILFNITAKEMAYKPTTFTERADLTRTDKIALKRIDKIRDDEQNSEPVRTAAAIVGDYIYQRMLNYIGYGNINSAWKTAGQ